MLYSITCNHVVCVRRGLYNLCIMFINNLFFEFRLLGHDSVLIALVPGHCLP